MKIPLAGDGFQAIGSPISHLGDRGAACNEEPESGGENPGWAAGFVRAEGWGREGTPYVDRRREDRDREEIGPVQH